MIMHAPKPARFLLGMVTLLLGTVSGYAEDEPQKPMVIAGGVVDEAGQPVPGAIVHCRQFAPGQGKVLTDENGRFEAVNGSPREQVVTVTATSPDQRLFGRVRHTRLEIQVGRKLDWHEFLSDLTITITPPFEAKVTVQDERGNRVADAVVGIRVDRQDLPPQRTDEEGQTTFEVPGRQPIDIVYARKGGLGLDYRSFFSTRRGRASSDLERKPFPEEGLLLTLEGAPPVDIIVRDQTGQPVEGAAVVAPDLMKQSENTRLERSVYITREERLTDAEGRLQFDWFPSWHRQPIQLTATKSDHQPARADYQPGDDGPVEIVLEASVPVRGQVLDHQGHPIAGVRVAAGGGGYLETLSSGMAITDGQGKYELRLSGGLGYLITVTHPGVTTKAQGPLAVLPGKPLEGIDLTRMEKPTRVFGMLTDRRGKPLPDIQIVCTQFHSDQDSLAELELPNPTGAVKANLPAIAQAMRTNEKGHFQFHLAPGHYTLRPYHGARGKEEKAVEFVLTNEVEKEIVIRIDGET